LLYLYQNKFMEYFFVPPYLRQIIETEDF